MKSHSLYLCGIAALVIALIGAAGCKYHSPFIAE